MDKQGALDPVYGKKKLDMLKSPFLFSQQIRVVPLGRKDRTPQKPLKYSYCSSTMRGQSVVIPEAILVESSH